MTNPILWECPICELCINRKSKNKHERHCDKFTLQTCRSCRLPIILDEVHSCKEEKPYQCCGYGWDSKKVFDKHRSLNHFVCFKCNTEYLGNRAHHERNCLPEKPYGCFIRQLSNIAAHENLPQLVTDLNEFETKVLPKIQRGIAITVAQFLKNPNQPWNVFIWDSEINVRKLLKLVSISVPILVSSVQMRPLSIDQTCNVLRARGRSLDIHTYKKPGDTPRIPISMQPEAALDYLSEYPANILNLGGLRNYPPECFKDLNDFNVLELSTESGKRETRKAFDLSDSARWQLLGSAGAVSRFHIDRHGVITSVFIDEGEKLWVMKPSPTKTDFDEYMENEIVPEGLISFHLRPGDLLIQPSGTFHSVVTLSTSLVSGWMFLDTRTLLGSIKYTLLQQRDPDITNEYISPEYIAKMEQIIAMQERGDSTRNWGPEGDLIEMRQRLEASNRIL